jgi:CotH kinase protein
MDHHQEIAKMTRKATAILTGVLGAALVAAPASAQGRGGGFGGPGGPGGFGGGERKVVAEYDRNADGILDNAERAAARTALGTTGGGGRGFGGGRGGGGGRGAARVAGAPGPKVTPAQVAKVPETVNLYDRSAVRTIFLTFENADWEQELETFHNTDVEVPATAVVDGKTYEGVGVHFRGASSYSMIPAGSKRSLNLSFDFIDGDQELYGYKTLNLLNANNDPTFVRTVLYSQIAQDYLPAPKANYVRVVINGELWGVYVNVQQFNKDMLKDFYEDADGARWKTPGSPNGRAGLEYLGDDPAAYKRLYEIKTKDEPESWNALIQLTRVLNQTPPAQLEAALKPILDIDGALKFLAVEAVLSNSDGYWTRASDYNLFRDSKGVFHVLPHDMNEALGIQGNTTLDPLVGLEDARKPLRSKLLAVPALRERYMGYVKDIATKWLDWNTVGPMVERYQAVIAADVAADTRKLYATEAFQSEVASLKSFAEARRAFLLQ